MKSLVGERRPAEEALPVTRTPGNLIQRKCACGGDKGVGEQCEGCSSRSLSLQRSPLAVSEPTNAPPIVSEVLRSPGQPLDAATRGFFEPRFGHDFSHVRVHTDHRAAESAQRLSALAYTVESAIAFGYGQYAPGTSAGRRLLAHELTHVVQQTGGLARRPSALEVVRADDSEEREADRIASSVPGQQTAHTTSVGKIRLAKQSASATPAAPAAATPKDLMDEGNAQRLSLLGRAISKAHQVEIACDAKAAPQLMIEALPTEVRAFVSWLGTTPADTAFCSLVRWAKALMIENMNMTVPPWFFPGPNDALCNYMNQWPYARFEDTRIKVCPKTVDPARTNSTERALIITHELFHAPLFKMEHAAPETMNSSHCGLSGRLEAIANPYCMTNVIGQLGGGDRCVM